MRQIVLDTETTGLEAARGHRIIEIGCVELVNRRASGRHYHSYLNPEREVDEGARAVHGMALADLADKPRFAEVADELVQFINGAELIIHNAAFDVGFLDAEFARLARDPPPRIEALCTVLDTLGLAREMHPGQRNTLDALCKRYGIDNTERIKHGALMDSLLLANVYVELLGERQATLGLGGQGGAETSARLRVAAAKPRPEPLRPRLSEEGVLAHREFIKTLGPKALWLRFFA